MVKKEEFEQAINSLKDEISQLKSLINEMKDDVVSALMKESVGAQTAVRRPFNFIKQNRPIQP